MTTLIASARVTSGVNPAARLFHHADAVLLLGETLDCRFAFGKCFGTRNSSAFILRPQNLADTAISKSAWPATSGLRAGFWNLPRQGNGPKRPIR